MLLSQAQLIVLRTPTFNISTVSSSDYPYPHPVFRNITCSMFPGKILRYVYTKIDVNGPTYVDRGKCVNEVKNCEEQFYGF